MKKLQGAVVIAVLFSSWAASAGPIYEVDPAASYVSVYTPTWVRGPDSGYFAPGGGLIVVPSWYTEWHLTAFPLSGSFAGTKEWSPYTPDYGHFTIADTRYRAATPASIAFLPPSFFSFRRSTGEVLDMSGPCARDPFYGSAPGWACLGLSTGFHAYVTGTISELTVELTGYSGGIRNQAVLMYSGSEPPAVDPALYPTNYTYRIIARAVPEPGTLWLFALGLMGAISAIGERTRGGKT